MEKYLELLNSQQRDAVTYIDGPELVIAGAGSGKTRVLTHKIMHLIKCGYEPWRILALTFTNKAAREMCERIDSLLGPNSVKRMWVGTFHSVFARIMRLNAHLLGYSSNYTIYDSADSKALIKIIIKDLNLDEKVYKPASVAAAISSAKNHLITAEEYWHTPVLIEADRSAGRGRIAEIYEVYSERCRVANAMDFDDLLLNMYLLLVRNPSVLTHYQELFRYIVVDEYQDTNFAQHRIIALLAAPDNRFCVVGDDAQSIYSFRGANIENILNLENEYPPLAIFRLEENYRSTQNIINAANSLIEKNDKQYRKNVFSRKEAGSLVEVVECYSDLEESSIVASRISQIRMNTGDSLEEFAILYRTNAQSRRLEESLRKRNIPYRIWGGLSFYQRKEVKDALGYFRAVVNPYDDEAIRRIINTPARKIGETTITRLWHCAFENSCSAWDVLCDPKGKKLNVSAATLKRLMGFKSLIEELIAKRDSADMNAIDLAKTIIARSGLLDQFDQERTPENISRKENVNELLTGVMDFVSGRLELGDERVSLSDFLSDVSLLTDQDIKNDGEESECVTLMTAHAAKGLEFNNVFIVGVEDDYFPSSMSKGSTEGIEEERRLLYVAITRARNFCMMSHARERYRNGQPIVAHYSPFLADIDPRYLKIIGGRFGRYYSQSGSSISRSTPKSTPHQSHLIRVTPSTATSSRPQNDSNNTTISGGYTTHSPAELHIGQLIKHQSFGGGKIESIEIKDNSSKITVLFNGENSPRVLMLGYAKFRLL